MGDPIKEAEKFTREAIEEGVRLAGELNRMHVEQQARDVARRFEHHPPTSDAVVSAHQITREMGAAFAQWMVNAMPWCPERDKAVDAIDLAVMHANAAIARYQLKHPTELVDTPRP